MAGTTVQQSFHLLLRGCHRTRTQEVAFNLASYHATAQSKEHISWPGDWTLRVFSRLTSSSCCCINASGSVAAVVWLPLLAAKALSIWLVSARISVILSASILLPFPPGTLGSFEEEGGATVGVAVVDAFAKEGAMPES